MRGPLKIRPVVTALLVIFGATVQSIAAPILTPSDLSPGDEYRLVFITTANTTAASSDITTYNDFVTSEALAQAELAGLGTTWRAIVSVPGIDARDNTLTNPGGPYATDIPIYLLDDNRLVNDYADLWDDSIMTNLRVTTDGTLHSSNNPTVWTGTESDGTEAIDRALGNISAFARLGNGNVSIPSLSTGAWIDTGLNVRTNQGHFMYGISDVLTVEGTNDVPEPSSMMLLGAGLIGLCGIGHRRKRRHARQPDAPARE